MSEAGTSMTTTATATPRRHGKLGQWIESWSRRWWQQYLARLIQSRGNLTQSFGDVPQRMHTVANQTRLVLELIDDFKSGTYRDVSWRSIAILSAAVLYSASPADVVPDFLPFVGTLDDLAVVAVATRFARRELEAYCEFKGYPLEEYFGRGT